MNPLFRDGGNLGVVRPDFESEPYFGAGWSAAQRTPAGRARHGSSGAVLLLPLETAYSYRLSLDLVAAGPASVDITANDVAVGTCELRGGVPCEIAVPAAAVREGVNPLKLSVRGSPPDGATLVFRGARVVRRLAELFEARSNRNVRD
jgi:hypothetical protein